ncbi:hypothetical protein PRIPAC_74531 [Pristionchus pacificus]|uniref:C2H2-type domain-containing protein n=1 Tax=Pristionchus pacificus TaxID=54126 RepID=A0A2A6BFB5_PRIPA|nr:hypothetical protein PRIPAC_74531 [Pristionchus pacificus]|eukprot:PDM64558.1 hypothetical protein PRIPAC_52814 [Pristionchus pacificus]
MVERMKWKSHIKYTSSSSSSSPSAIDISAQTPVHKLVPGHDKDPMKRPFRCEKCGGFLRTRRTFTLHMRPHAKNPLFNRRAQQKLNLSRNRKTKKQVAENTTDVGCMSHAEPISIQSEALTLEEESRPEYDDSNNEIYDDIATSLSMYTHDDEHYQRKRGTDSAERDGRKEMRSRV